MLIIGIIPNAHKTIVSVRLYVTPSWLSRNKYVTLSPQVTSILKWWYQLKADMDPEGQRFLTFKIMMDPLSSLKVFQESTMVNQYFSSP